MREFPKHDSPSDIQRFLQEERLAPSRRFGQNFLVNPGVRRKILELLELHAGDRVWEIGPGLGAMTEELAGHDGDITLFEIDRRFAEFLRSLYKGNERVEVVEGDFLQTREEMRRRKGNPDRILGNLPYNAASRIIAAILEGDVTARRMVFTVQKEVGLRMMTKPGGKEYSSFSVLCGLYCSVVDGGDVAAGSFYPVPKVVSKIVVLEPHQRYGEETRRIAATIAGTAFSSRRKTLRNTLKGLPSALSGHIDLDYGAVMAALEHVGIDPGERGEKLSVEEYAAAAEALRDMME